MTRAQTAASEVLTIASAVRGEGHFTANDAIDAANRLARRALDAEGTLDLIEREAKGEPADSIASDYGGMGYENHPAVLMSRAVRASTQALADAEHARWERVVSRLPKQSEKGSDDHR